MARSILKAASEGPNGLAGSGRSHNLASSQLEKGNLKRTKACAGCPPIHAWVGDVTRFRIARRLCSYAGLVPSVHQSGETERMGGVTKQGLTPLRSILVRRDTCCSTSAALRAIANRIHKDRDRRRIAIVAAARHILRLAFYVPRDATDYNPGGHASQ